MKADVKFDLRPIQRAIKQLQPHVKKSRRELTEQAAKGFVKEVVEITPPGGSGRRGSAAKKTGEAAIKYDLGRIMFGVRVRANEVLQNPVELHQRFRDMRTGRINPRNLKNPYPVDVAALRAFQQELIARVGKLAGGWNAGAAKLGVKLPAWVSRQGGGRGAMSVVDTFRLFRITIINAVKYVNSVADYERRIQSAITIQANKMRRQAEFLLTRALKHGGWK
jgi:hypothetical protein